MSQHTFTRHHHTWTVGSDPAMASYYARRQPLSLPRLVALPELEATPRQRHAAAAAFTAAHTRAMRQAYDTFSPDTGHGTEQGTRTDDTETDHPDGPVHLAHRRYLQLLEQLHTGTSTAVPPADPVTTITGDIYGQVRSLEELRGQLRAAGITLPPAVDVALELERRGTYTHTDRYPATRPAPEVPGDVRTALDLARQAFPGTSPARPVSTPPPAASPRQPPGPTPGRHTH